MDRSSRRLGGTAGWARRPDVPPQRKGRARVDRERRTGRALAPRQRVERALRAVEHRRGALPDPGHRRRLGGDARRCDRGASGSWRSTRYRRNRWRTIAASVHDRSATASRERLPCSLPRTVSRDAKTSRTDRYGHRVGGPGRAEPPPLWLRCFFARRSRAPPRNEPTGSASPVKSRPDKTIPFPKHIDNGRRSNAETSGCYCRQYRTICCTDR